MSLAACCVARGDDSDSLAPRGIQNNEFVPNSPSPKLRNVPPPGARRHRQQCVVVEYRRRLREPDAVFPEIGRCLLRIPLKFHNRNIRAYLYTQLVLRSSGPAVGTLVGDLPHQFGAAAVRRRESMTSLRTEMAAGGPLGGLRENTAAVAIFRSVRSREISEKYML